MSKEEQLQALLIKLRGEKTQAELASAMKDAGHRVTRAAVSHWETGERQLSTRGALAYRTFFSLEGEELDQLNRLFDAQFSAEVAA